MTDRYDRTVEANEASELLRARVAQLESTIEFFHHLEQGWYRAFGKEPINGEPNLDVLIGEMQARLASAEAVVCDICHASETSNSLDAAVRHYNKYIRR